MATLTWIPCLTCHGCEILSDFLNLNYTLTTLIIAMLVIPLLSYPFIPPIGNLPERTVAAALSIVFYLYGLDRLLSLFNYSHDVRFYGFKPLDLPQWMFHVSFLAHLFFMATAKRNCPQSGALIESGYIVSAHRRLWAYIFAMSAAGLVCQTPLPAQPIVVQGVVWTLLVGIFLLECGPLSGHKRMVRDMTVLILILLRVSGWLMMARGVGFTSRGEESSAPPLVSGLNVDKPEGKSDDEDNEDDKDDEDMKDKKTRKDKKTKKDKRDKKDNGNKKDKDKKSENDKENEKDKKDEKSDEEKKEKRDEFILDLMPWSGILVCGVVAVSTGSIFFRLVELMRCA
ncbi:hypothetical protein V8F20_006790 [Naviculisporaceae sp. PSN 640]